LVRAPVFSGEEFDGLDQCSARRTDMNAATDLKKFVDDLAGFWTERVLERLAGAGIRPISVDMEVETWKALKKLVCFELQRSGRGRSDYPPPLRLSALGG
jgi:hypothetical protein